MFNWLMAFSDEDLYGVFLLMGPPYRTHSKQHCMVRRPVQSLTRRTNGCLTVGKGTLFRKTASIFTIAAAMSWASLLLIAHRKDMLELDTVLLCNEVACVKRKKCYI